MKRIAFVIAIVILVALTQMSTSKAQSTVQDHPADTGAEKFSSEPISIEAPSGTLYGTLTLPQSRKSTPVVLIISGSGPTDRDGNSPLLKGPNNSLKMLSESLAAHGIASVRYDKRGIGETGKAMFAAAQKAKIQLREEDLRFEAYINDALSWARQLRADRRFSSLIVVGHSEGSLIGMVTAQRAEANGFVSIAGAGRSLQELILEQVKSQLTPELMKTTEHILEQLAAGKTVQTVPNELHMLLRPSVQQFLISWMRYDPGKEISKLRMPVLIIQGTTDLQTRIADAKRLADGNPSAKLLMIDGMNHVLKMVPNEPAQQAASYSDPTLPVATDLVKAVTGFVNENRESK